MQPTNSKVSLVFFLFLLLILLTLNVVMVAPFLLAVLMGAILAALARPWHRKLCAKGIGPRIASIIMVFAILFLVIVPIGLFTWQAAEQGVAFFNHVTGSNSAANFSLKGMFEKVDTMFPVSKYLGSLESLEKQLRASLQQGAKAASGVLLVMLGKIPDALLQLALAMFTTYFLLIDGTRFKRWLTERLPLEPDVQQKISTSYRDTSISVIVATLAAAGAQGLVMFLSFLIVGLPGAFLAGGATFIFAWIPVLGSLPVWITGAILLYTEGAIFKMIVLIVLGLFTGVIDNVVRPLVLKGRGDMHPLISLVAIFGGIQMFGIFGVFFGPILTAILLTLLDVWPLIGKRAGMLKSG